MANHYYNLKCIIPILSPARDSETGAIILKEVAIIERINLLNRDHLISGTRPTNAFANFLSCSYDRDNYYGVEVSNSFGYNLPLANHLTYLVIIESVRKTFYYAYSPCFMKEDEMVEFLSLEEISTTHNLTAPIELTLEVTPIDSLLKLKKENQPVTDKALSYIEFKEVDATPRFIAHSIKSIKGQWISPNVISATGGI
jgi:hypothetical protein